MWQRLNFVGQNSRREYHLIQKSLLMPFLQSCCFAILSLSTTCLWAKSPFVFPAFAVSAAFFALPATPAHAVCSMTSGIRRKWRAHLSWGIEGLMRMPFIRMCSNWRDTDKVCWSLCGGHQQKEVPVYPKFWGARGERGHYNTESQSRSQESPTHLWCSFFQF